MKKVEKKSTKNKIKGTLVTLILDESGSMQSCKEDTIGGYNEYTKKLQKDGTDILFSFTKFDSTHVTKIHEAIEIKKVKSLTNEDYTPGASTPLYDAIGKTINSTDSKNRNVICVIITDGQENSSHEFSKEAINSLIKEKTKAGWTFVYLGANQDAWSVGMSLGLAKGNIKNYNTDDIKMTFGAMATMNCDYSSSAARGAYQTSNAFNQDENDSNLKA